ncbi:MAG: hydrogenase [Candidatus Fischerbacteria bacterium RBG_13_37_8]|uniref:Hydrogenase n=1 Tax=Candidatus Fischerbacteria bacterium RBG_13_37_8 TaxID=1817863 RepID=A0A1F5V610_9BACT|nr:MAG: hydrogenase [Candidatus Fischerbacteria bacterium RBG_13_37_8]
MTKTESLLKKYNNKPNYIIQILQDIQEEHNYLPKEVLHEVSRGLHIPLSKVYSIATFYNIFSLKPRGKHLITVCVGTACHVRGAQSIVNEFERRLGIKSKENTPDMEYTLDSVNCLGCCAIGPVVVSDGKFHGGFKTKDVEKLLGEKH